MRVRVITQTFTDLWRHRAMMNPWRSGFYAVQLFSHKVLRYFVPLFLFAILVTSAILATGSRLYAVTLAAQLLFYALAVGGWLLERSGARRLRVLALPQYFLLANVASVIACFKFLSGERYARWEPVRDSQPSGSSKVATVGQPGRD